MARDDGPRADEDKRSDEGKVHLPPTPPYTPLSLFAMPKTKLSSLPTEILDLILSHLPLSSLAVCAVLGRSFLPLARQHLYRLLPLRNQRDGQACPTGTSTLDEPSTALISTLETHRDTLAPLAQRLDFDLLSHLPAEEVATILSRIFALCTGIVDVRLGAGSHGHGMGYRCLLRALVLHSPAADRLRVLGIEECAGASHTLALVLLKTRELKELRIGQFLLEDEDLEVFCSGQKPECELEAFTARQRITPLAFDFCTAASAATLRTADLPICEKTALDLSPFSSLTSITLFVFLSAAPTPFAPSHPSFAPTMSRLNRNFASTIASVPYLQRLTLKGLWDCAITAPPGASAAVDLVRHAELLEALPSESGGLQELVIKSELNSIALTRWLANDACWVACEVERNSGCLMDQEIAEVPDRTTLPPFLRRQLSPDIPPTSPASVASITPFTASPVSSSLAQSPLSSRPSTPPPDMASLPSPPSHTSASTASLRRLQLWQKQTYSAARRHFQANVRKKVDEEARRRGVQIEWRMYEKW
ncbi:F-box domain containing protein [Rhodotorula toruloides]|uniref:F-box domain containing protein n=1 Tax=Rhodotorula toruloides TaxID=5286 RepID=A0A511KP23_RHOTO|nr:F-box domain containing protein [Rhodotorula toruloides]